MIKRMSVLTSKHLKFLLSFALALCSYACEFPWQKAPPMDAAKFAQVYVGLLQVTVGDSLPAARADSVFQAHRMTQQNFEVASQYYSAEAERWVEVLKLVVAQLDSQMAAEVPKAPRGLNR